MPWIALLPVLLGLADEPQTPHPPNIIILFSDDLGYGDLGCYGHPTIRTPNLDRMAREGQRWTSFYVAASVCTPSRAGLMTGRLPIRSGMCSARNRVLFPDSAGGLPASEVTIAEGLKTVGYDTLCIGKWHLGHRPESLPTRHGFDHYFGIPYSNDMDRADDAPRGRIALLEPKVEYFRVPLMRDEEVVERPADQTTLTRRYTEEAIRFAESHRERPFFLYLAYSFPHVPLFRSEPFVGRSERGTYGDVVEEIDASVGQLLDALKRLGLDERTIVFFTSDNGPWLIFDTHGGSAGLLRDGKGSTWEGGMREPFLVRWPGKVPAGETVYDLGSTLDLLPTCLSLAGGEVPKDRILDGFDLSDALLGSGHSPRQVMFYYRGTELYAIRYGSYKAHFLTQPAYGQDMTITRHDPPLLYHLGHDPSERFDVAAEHPEVIAEIRKLAEGHRRSVEPVANQLDTRTAGR